VVDVGELSLMGAVEMVKEKEASMDDIIDKCYENIKRYDDRLKAFISRNEYTDDYLKKVRRTPLKGAPISIKDIFYTRGMITTAGSKILRDFIPIFDAKVVSKLVNAGAFLIGKTNLDEFAFGVTNKNPHYGYCRNPWDTERISGGSSGGSAVSLATGMCLASVGTDTAGSIRIPASLWVSWAISLHTT